MRKFLDFVVRDDPPILTPPSEDESGFGSSEVNDTSNGQQQHTLVVSDRNDEANHLLHQLAKRVSIDEHETASQQRFHQYERNGIHPAVSKNTKPKAALESTTSNATSLSASSQEYSNGKNPHDKDEDLKRAATALEPVFASDTLDVRKQIPSEPNRGVLKTLKPDQFRQTLKKSVSRSDQRLRSAASILSQFALEDADNSRRNHDEDRLRETRLVVGALREIAETMVWADQHEPSLWDTFMECAIMPLFLQCLQATESFSAPIHRKLAGSYGNSSSDGAKEAATSDINKGDASNQQHQIEAQKPQSESASLNPGAVSNMSSDEPKDDEVVGVDVIKITTQTAERIAVEVQSQILQTLSIMIQSIFRQHSLLCLFSSNHINEILSFSFRFGDDEMLGYFMSAVKTIALKLDSALLQLFFDPSRGTFPLYRTVVRFFDHREQMVRIAVRNVTLTIYALGDPEVLKFAARDESSYIVKTVDLLKRLYGNVARSFELLIDDGREVRRTRTRTGIFRRNVRTSEVAGKLEEAENILAYLTDVSSLSKEILRPLIERLLLKKLVTPFFRPLASRASPAAILLEKKWRLTNRTVDRGTPALSVFDAAARCLLVACILRTCRSSCLGHFLVDELSRSISEFEDRSVLHGLKAMAADFTGTEKVSFVSLCAIESFLLCDATTKEKMKSFRYDLQNAYSKESFEALESFTSPFDNTSHNGREEQRSMEGPLLMTLSEFEAPLTPANSLPSTPKHAPPSPSDNSTSSKGMLRPMSANSLSADGITISEGIEPDEAIMMFQHGETSIRDTISSLILVVRRREVRTLRTIRAACRILTAIGAKTNDYKLCVEASKSILSEIAEVMQSFLRNKRTTIVAIERMFENFRTVAVENCFESDTTSSLEDILSPDVLPKVAGDYPEGAGKRRRALRDDATPPIEREDALVFFCILETYEQALEERDKEEVLVQKMNLQRSEDGLSSTVRQTLLNCNFQDSYLDKRDALLDIAREVLGHEEVN